MRKFLTEKRIMVLLAIFVMLAFAVSIFSAFRAFNLSPGEQVIIPGGAVVAKPTNNIADVSISSDGFLILKYEDGTERQAGYILQKGERGDDGQGLGPTDAQVAAAVAAYCTTDGRCDPKSPSATQVALAVSEYCSSRGECKGPSGNDGGTGATGATGNNGVDGQNATPEQIMAAVQQYCSNNNCQGPKGDAGSIGPDGQSPVMNCVIRDESGVDRQYVAWKYSTEADTEYRDLYLLPVWAQGSDCVDLSGTA